MRWFSRAKPKGQQPGPTHLVAGIHRSPGMDGLCTRLQQRGASSILDLGPSSTENLAFFSSLGAQVQIQDLFRSCGGEYGTRAALYRFPAAESLPLPSEGPFDAVLLWDLLHYMDRAQIPPLIERIVPLLATGAELLVIASAKAAVPPTPMQFRIVDSGQLEYQLFSDQLVAPPDLTPRVVEQLMPGFRPNRFFQLRNGLQEFLFGFEGAGTETRDETADGESDEDGAASEA